MSWENFWVFGTFALYIFIAWRCRVKSTGGFYVAGHGVPAIANGMATGADWMSAASFLGMAGLIAFKGYTASAYLLGWTGGFVLLALLLAPYLRKFGAYTVPDFVGDRYYSGTARVVALVCAIFVSLTYISGQMQGVGIMFSRFFEVSNTWGIIYGTAIVFFYATLGGMKGITWTQVAQYCVLICAYVIPAIAISLQFTGNPVPQLGMGSELLPGQLGTEGGVAVLERLDQMLIDLGFAEDYTSSPSGEGAMLNMVLLTVTLMVGTAGLPHVIIRFYTTKTVRAARWSAFWALLFIGILYTTAPAVASFARANLVHTMHQQSYEDAPAWLKKWEDSGLIGWVDKNDDGVIQLAAGEAMTTAGKSPVFLAGAENEPLRGAHGQRLIEPDTVVESNPNELYVHPDILVVANPEIAGLHQWIVGLVIAGGLAAALSTAAGLLLVISSSISHDLVKRTFKPDMGEKEELRWARGAAAGAVVIAAWFGVNPPAFVAQTVAFAFGLAASSFFPVIVLGIFWKRATKQGAIAGMLTGLIFTSSYIVFFTPFLDTFLPNLPAEYKLFGIEATGIGAVGMLLNFVVTVVVSRCTPPPPEAVQANVEAIRYPRIEGRITTDQASPRPQES